METSEVALVLVSCVKQTLCTPAHRATVEMNCYRNSAAGIRTERTMSRQPSKESAVLMSVPREWGTVTPPMFPCVRDGITLEREGTRIGRERREEGPTWILAALCRV